MNIDLTSPAQLLGLLREHGFHTKKRFGQNFLVDRNIVNKVADALDLQADDCVLEIGPGVGTLTQVLAERCRSVVAVEVDHDLIEILAGTLGDYPNAEIVGADILSLSLAEFIAEEFGCARVKVVGNLPYYITSPIIAQIFEVKQSIERVVLMVQKEVAERLVGRPGTKDYGSMSVFVQYHSMPEIVAQVPKTVFFPPPEVCSAVVRITPHQAPPVSVPSEELFFKVVRSAFGKRRKTLLNSLTGSTSLGLAKPQVAAILEAASIDPIRRAETLSLEEFAAITRAVSGIIG